MVGDRPAPGLPSRTRAALVLGGAVLLAVLLLIGLVISLVGVGQDPPREDQAAPAPPTAQRPQQSGETEGALAARPMLQVPLAASQPHAMTSDTAGPTLALPAASTTVGSLVPQGFPATLEGAVAQLAALTEVGVRGGDPQDYVRAYREIAEPGAPPAERSLLASHLAGFRTAAQLPRTGPKAGLSVTWEPVSAQIKGTVDDEYTVVCVLGQFTADYEGQVASAGLGDCQGMRRVSTSAGDQWRIASGPQAASAPSPWPGTAEAVAAGYREITR